MQKNSARRKQYITKELNKNINDNNINYRQNYR